MCASMTSDPGSPVLTDDCQQCGMGTLTIYRKTAVQGYGSSEDRRTFYRALCSTPRCTDENISPARAEEAGLSDLPPL
ncbi:hypothetical protein SEA_MARTEENA_31 [Gordonia phage Marteena]|nr:hypothetical protein SEA_EMSQUAREDA_31 [Gordonia phage EMsquaredA]QDP45116.1 hypothetical protein SEA_MARTEENA_31 [Gordonia phage Marteena]